VAINEELENWILSWGSKAIVLYPEVLKDRIRGEAQKMAAGYKIDD